MKNKKPNIRNNTKKRKVNKCVSKVYKGVLYKSFFEKRIAMWLDTNGFKFQYETKKLLYKKKLSKGRCIACGSHDVYEEHIYTPDFILSNGLIIEAKGKFTSTDRTKMASVVLCNPDLKIKMLFMYDNFITKKKLQRYSEWCTQRNIEYTIFSEDMPKGWFKK